MFLHSSHIGILWHLPGVAVRRLVEIGISKRILGSFSRWIPSLVWGVCTKLHGKVTWWFWRTKGVLLMIKSSSALISLAWQVRIGFLGPHLDLAWREYHTLHQSIRFSIAIAVSKARAFASLDRQWLLFFIVTRYGVNWINGWFLISLKKIWEHFRYIIKYRGLLEQGLATFLLFLMRIPLSYPSARFILFRSCYIFLSWSNILRLCPK